ncbi:FkbM family methyltransferase [Rhodocyclus tenuis]|uniref:FkbM family methyltransferase n=1 Tax=Rhodocyclus tenuis TaxID=1066 RepID=UPI0019086235|nr:FkbM family methyltransferase [Rhodocyclus tenuis]MBK1679293.1 hypothetical protein [Rhodocyclus tenuis]
MKRQLVRGLEAFLRRFGIAVLPEWRLGYVGQETYLRSLFARLSVDCVIDVGANVGQYRDFLRERVGYGGWILSFEPVAEHVEQMRARAGDDAKWRILEYALGAEPGVLSFNVMRSSVFSSFLLPDHAHTTEFVGQNEVSRVVEVEMRTLDELLPPLLAETGARAPYLKLDTQGFDIEVARGACTSLAAMVALQTEASVTPIYAGMPGYRDSIDYFAARGFRLGGIFPVHPDAVLGLVEFDCHMVNAGRAGI